MNSESAQPAPRERPENKRARNMWWAREDARYRRRADAHESERGVRRVGRSCHPPL